MLKVAKIIPHKKLPKKIGMLDYFIPKELENQLKVGDFCYVPFKSLTLLGLVAEISNETQFKTAKEVVSLEERLTSLPEWQVKLIKWFAEYYQYSLGSLLKIMVPEVPKRKSKLAEADSSSAIEAPKVLPKVIKIAEQVMCSNDKKFLLFPNDQQLKVQLFVQLAQEQLKQNKQILMIMPQIHQVEKFYQNLPKELQEETVVFTNQVHTAKNKFHKAWQDIAGNKKKIIIGTRSAIFAPVTQIGTIIIDDAHSDDLKQWDQNPRYEVQAVAKKMQVLTDCRLIISSLAPRIEDSYQAKNEEYKLITLGAGRNKVDLIDLKKIRQTGFTYFSEQLLDQVKSTVQNNQKCLLIVNKKGEYSYFFCSDCGYESKCEKCQFPMVVSGSFMKCNHCNIKKSIPLNCPSCHGHNMKMLGIGIEQVRNNLVNDHKILTHIVDESTETVPDAQVYLSTGKSFDLTKLVGVGLLGFVYIDSLVYLADFNSNYRLYSFIMDIISKVSPKTAVSIQTVFADNPAFKNLNSAYREFYQTEINQRKNFGYPPFTILLKIFFDHHDGGVADREARELYSKLQQCEFKDFIRFTEPYLYYRQMVRQRYRYQIGVFLDPRRPEIEEQLVKLLPDHWTIDKNPLNML